MAIKEVGLELSNNQAVCVLAAVLELVGVNNMVIELVP